MHLLLLTACIDTGLVTRDEGQPAFDSDTSAVDTSDSPDTSDSSATDDTARETATDTVDTAQDTVDTSGDTAVDTAPDTSDDPPTPIVVEGYCTSGYAYTSWTDTAATEPELNVVGVYESQSGPGGPVTVRVTRTAEMILVLTSYSSVEWQIDLDAGHDIREILISSYDPSTWVFTGAGTATVIDVGWVGDCAYEIPDLNPSSGCETPDLEANLEGGTGLSMSSFQGCYAGGEYTIAD